MNQYTVVSKQGADSDLAEIWQAARDRSQITNASDDADRKLAQNPKQNAIHLAEGLWRLEVAPLRFYFEIREEDRIVAICNVVLVTSLN